MDKWFAHFDRLSEEFLEGLKKAPETLRKNKRLIEKLLFCIVLFLIAAKISVSLISATFYRVVNFWLQNKESIIGLLIVACVIYSIITSHREKRRKDTERKIAEEAKRLERNAKTNYVYLRSFLYQILDERLCSLIGIVKPVSPNLLNDVHPLTQDDSHHILYFNYKVCKLDSTPFSQGTEYVKNLLSSRIIGKAQIDGIEGITALTGDSLVTPVYVDAVKDLGSTAVFVLVFDSEAYRKLKSIPDASEIDHNLIEHI